MPNSLDAISNFPIRSPRAILAHCRQSGQTESCHSSSLPHRMQLSSPFSQACQQPLHGRLRSISQSAAHRHRRYPKTCCRYRYCKAHQVTISPHGPLPGFPRAGAAFHTSRAMKSALPASLPISSEMAASPVTARDCGVKPTRKGRSAPVENPFSLFRFVAPNEPDHCSISTVVCPISVHE